MNKPRATCLGHFIRNQYIIPSGKSITWWAEQGSFDSRFLAAVLNLNKEKTITVPTIIKLSALFKEAPQKFIRIQNEFKLAKFLRTNTNRPVKRIKAKKVHKKFLIRNVLLNGFLKPMNLRILDLTKHVGAQKESLWKYFSNSTKWTSIDYKIAGRVGDAFGTGPKFWLDLQSKLNLDRYLEENPHMIKYFDDDWNPPTTFSFNKSEIKEYPINPGAILMKDFLMPLGIPNCNWADYLCVGHETFNRIIKGKVEMDFRFIGLLKKAFGTKASYWINLQNQYLSYLYLKKYASVLNIKPIKARIAPKKMLNHLCPSQVLRESFLKPLNLKPSEFGRLIGMRKHTVKHLLSKDCYINVARAVKLGQAFGTSAMYWLDLQMEYDLSRARKRK